MLNVIQYCLERLYNCLQIIMLNSQQDDEESISYWTECHGIFIFHRNKDGKLVN